MEIDLSINLCGKKLDNPLILASGFLGTKAELLARVAKAGAGAVTTKSCSLKSREGNENPTVLAWEHGIQNAVGLTNPGAEKEAEEISKLRKLLRHRKTLIIASIFGATIGEIVKTSIIINQAKPDFIELNVSCPHADPQVKGQFYNHPQALEKLVKSVKKSIRMPLIIKLSPNVENIGLIAQAAEKSQADAISAINTLGPGMVIDLVSGKPILSNKVGGLSGPAVKPIALRCVYDIYEAVKIPIIGMGGIIYGKDALEITMVGATGIGIGSAIYYRGLTVFNKVLREMKAFMKKEDYPNLKSLRGKSHAQN